VDTVGMGDLGILIVNGVDAWAAEFCGGWEEFR
jgi:hypothetical protein